jgi:hypothetical protein
VAKADKPYAMIKPYEGRAYRWYPHEALQSIVSNTTVSGPEDNDEVSRWALLDPADARYELPVLKENLRGLTEFVKMIEAIADGRQPATCPVCEKRFYPLRVDARYCGGNCRVRAHRAAS